MADGGPQVVAYVLGTEGDPQVYSRQRPSWRRPVASCPRRTRGRRTPRERWRFVARAARKRAVTDPQVLLITYSTKPRGGVVHTLALAEALHATGAPVHVLALGDPAAGFFRPVAAPVTIVPGPSGDGTLEEKVAGSIDRLAAAIAQIGTLRCCTPRTASRLEPRRACGTPARQ